MKRLVRWTDVVQPFLASGSDPIALFDRYLKTSIKLLFNMYFRHYHRHETLKMKKTFNFATHASAKEQRFAVALGVFVEVFSYKSYKHSVTEP